MMTAKEAKYYSSQNLFKYEKDKADRFISQLEEHINNRIQTGFFESSPFTFTSLSIDNLSKIKDYMAHLGYKYNTDERSEIFWFSWD